MKNSRIFQTSEGKVLIAGVLMLVFLIGFIGYYGLNDITRAKSLLLALVAHTFGGRAAGVGICIMNELNLVWTIVYNFYLEVLIVCFTYSAFVLTLNNYIKIQWIESLTTGLMEKADKNKELIRKYGWVGVFLFVMFPLPVTGPVVGSAIGYLLKMKVWHNLTAVFLGTLAAIIVWAFCFDFLEQHIHILQYVLIGIVSIVILSHIRSIKQWIVETLKSKE